MVFDNKEIYNVIKNSFKQAVDWKLWKWLAFSSTSGIVGFLTMGDKLLGVALKTSIQYAIAILIIIFIVRFFAKLLKNGLRYYHEVYQNSIYGDAIITLKETFAVAHKYRKLEQYNDVEFLKLMKLFCNNLSSIFSKILNEECSVSIKVPLRNIDVEAQTTLVNLVRDDQNRHRDTEDYKKANHTIIGNTAFIYVLNKVTNNSKDKFYINNDVNNTSNYENTSRNCYEHKNGDSKDNKLAYNSEIVLPLVPIHSIDDGNNHKCRGFICVDTKKPNAFTSKYDVPIIEGIADGIYDIISSRSIL